MGRSSRVVFAEGAIIVVERWGTRWVLIQRGTMGSFFEVCLKPEPIYLHSIRRVHSHHRKTTDLLCPAAIYSSVGDWRSGDDIHCQEAWQVSGVEGLRRLDGIHIRHVW